MPAGLGRFILPDMCCLCLGQAELLHECSTPGGEGGRSFVTTIQVPICRRCQSRLKMKRAIIGLGAVVLFVGGAAAIWGTEGQMIAQWRYWAGGVGMGLGLVLALFLLAGPATVNRNDDGIAFTNKAYQRLFDEANGRAEAKASREA